ncbi:MAG: hypothetical protein H6760_04560 [Candidatus Nomurabacteria bacterium]|nr:MAG: hypothetical protein H6760_04560 [Candidatus Nomurabacteria bacterium]
MKKILATFSFILLASPSIASAHTGVEHTGTFWHIFLHLLSEPDHIFIIGSIVILGYGVLLHTKPQRSLSRVPRGSIAKY